MIKCGELISIGGVIIKDVTEKIICKNTLDLRIELAFLELLPDIRKRLFTKEQN